MKLIGRRNFLAGMGLGAGSSLLPSIFRSMMPEALGQTRLPRRLIIHLKVYGSEASHRPQPGASDDSFTLGTNWSPLEKYHNELLFFDSFNNPYNRFLHGNRWPLSVVSDGHKDEEAGTIPPGGISFDRFMGGQLGKTDAWPSLNLSPVWPDPKGYYGSSADGPGKVFPILVDPVDAYAKIFAGGSNANLSIEAPRRLARDQSLLDFLRADVTRLSTGLAAPERAKLDQYLDSVRGMETRLAAFSKSKLSCSALVPPARAAFTPTWGLDGVAYAQMFAAHTDLGINALACGLTHVVLFQFAGDYYKFLGEDGRIGHHHMWHDEGTPIKFQKFYNYHATFLAGLRDRLGQLGEGNGSMADSTLTMMIDEGGGAHHNGSDRIPVMLLGRLGGALRTGRFLKFAKGQRVVSDVFVSVANLLGVPINTFGTMSAGPLPGLS